MENLKKLLTFLMLGVFLISFASSLELQPIEKVGYDWDNVKQFTIDETTSKYGKYEIRNSVLGLSWFQYGKVADIELINNSDICGEGCFADIPITLYEDGILVDDITFETKQPDGSWKYQSIRSYQFSYQGEIQDYKTVCTEIGQYSNGTIIKECNQVEDGTHIGKINYKEGTIVRAGTYLLRLDGNKKPSRTVDWIIKTNGIWTNEWATWGNISLGNDSEVILNSPADESTSLVNEVTFNCSANITGGSILINISLYTNQSGVWEVKNTTTVGVVDEGLVSYYTLDDNLATTNVIDELGVNNGTANIITSTLSTIGKIENAFNLTDGSKYVNISTEGNSPFDFNDDFSFSFWIKPSNLTSLFSVMGSNLGSLSYGGWAMWISGSGQLQYIQQNDTDQPQTRTNTVSMILNDWNHIVFVRNGTQGRFYLNGTLITSYQLDHVLSPHQATTQQFQFSYSDVVQSPFILDEVGIWNRSLSSSEVTELWNGGDGGRPLQTSSQTQTWTRTITEPTLWNCQACDSDGDCGFATANFTVHLDSTPPQIEVQSPNGTLDYNFIGNNETLNVTFTDNNLDSCWYNYNGTNITIEGCLTGVKNSTQFILEVDNLNMTLYANDSVGNENSTFINWSYNLLEKELTYSSNITEGELNVISIKVIIIEGSSITNSILTYNGENLTTSIIYDGENYTIISNNAAPIVDEDRNITFNFFISVDGIEYETNSNNQTVVNQNFGICGGISNDTLLNMSLFDEETLEELVGDIEFNARIISKSSGDTIGISNTTFSDVHSGAVCFSPIESYPLYFLNAEIRYFKDGYVTEFYNIQKADLADYPNNLSLFSLNENDSTEFSVTYKNNNFIFTEGAIIQLQRKYIGEDIYRTVEAPITGDSGKTTLHIDLNTNKYRVSVVKEGELLDFFENIAFSCDNELAGDCRHSLDGTVNPNNDIPIETITDFSYSVSIDEDNQTVTVLFSVPSGTSSTINVLLKQIDMFGNLTSCNTTIITSAGSIACDYVDTIEKSILELHISKNDVELVVLSFVNDPELDMDGMNFFIVFLFMISLVGMAISSPEWMIIISVMVLIISGTMLLLSGTSLVMGLGAIAWVIIAAAIIIMKMAKQEDR